jgi:hypothetical protein
MNPIRTTTYLAFFIYFPFFPLSSLLSANLLFNNAVSIETTQRRNISFYRSLSLPPFSPPPPPSIRIFSIFHRFHLPRFLSISDFTALELENAQILHDP